MGVSTLADVDKALDEFDLGEIRRRLAANMDDVRDALVDATPRGETGGLADGWQLRRGQAAVHNTQRYAEFVDIDVSDVDDAADKLVDRVVGEYLDELTTGNG